MGKCYAKELELLGKTYSWARLARVDELSSLIDRVRRLPLIAIGSGGSLSVAAFCSYLHECLTGSIAKATTPLDAVLSGIHGPSHAALLLTAGGGNPDVLGAIEHLANREIAVLGALCTRKRSPLAREAKKHSSLALVEYNIPSGKDGFLATNSLLAMAVLLLRAYGGERIEELLADTLSQLLEDRGGQVGEPGSRKGRPIWERRSFVVLCSPCTQPAAMDLESKFTEAAIANVQCADFRNFAHGRHHWIAKEHRDTAVIAFVTDNVRKVADQTLKVLPEDVATLVVDVGPEGPVSAISALVHTLYLVGAAGSARGIDPGRPHIPPFGRKIYHLKAFSQIAIENGLSRRERIAISRKARQSIQELERSKSLDAWRDHYHAFIERLGLRTIRAVVLDYDGTLCEPAERFSGPDKSLLRRIAQLAKSGLSIGVVTGRGQSVRDALRAGLPKPVWAKVLVGYYNGGIIRPLSANDSLREVKCDDSKLLEFGKVLNADTRLASMSDIECRAFQVSLQPKVESNRRAIWELLQQHVGNFPGVRLVESSHSIDALAPGVSKLDVVRAICRQSGIEDSGDVLCIGDCGRWPGNDFELLSEPTSLSVGSASAAPDTCWNIALPENQFTSATHEYLTTLFSVRQGKLELKRGSLKD